MLSFFYRSGQMWRKKMKHLFLVVRLNSGIVQNVAVFDDMYFVCVTWSDTFNCSCIGANFYLNMSKRTFYIFNTNCKQFASVTVQRKNALRCGSLSLSEFQWIRVLFTRFFFCRRTQIIVCYHPKKNWI